MVLSSFLPEFNLAILFTLSLLAENSLTSDSIILSTYCKSGTMPIILLRNALVYITDQIRSKFKCKANSYLYTGQADPGWMQLLACLQIPFSNLPCE